MRVLSCSSSVACFRTSALFYCSQSLVFVLVAWCRTFHERSLCSLRRVLVKSCPVARDSCSSGTPQQQHSFAQLTFLFPPAHSWDISLERNWAAYAFRSSDFRCFARLCYAVLAC